MKKHFPKIIMIAVITALFLTAIFFIVLANKYRTAMLSCRENASFQAKDNKQNAQVNTDQWSQYHDSKYGYSISLPPGLDVDTIYNYKVQGLGNDYKIINAGVFFSLGGGPGFAVMIFENNQYSSLNDWIADSDKGRIGVHYVIEDRLIVDGYQAILIKPVPNDSQNQDTESYEYEREIVFFKNKQLFVIHPGAGVTKDKIISSFKFDK